MKTQPKFTLRALNLALPEMGPERHASYPSPQGFVEWFSGMNDFPVQLNERARLSGTHSRILRDKVIYAAGKGFSFSGPASSRAENYAAAVNARGESLREVYRRIAADYVRHGNAFLSVIDAGGGRFNLEHIDAASCRLGRGENEGYLLFSRCWQQHYSAAYTPVRIPLAGKVQKGSRQFVVHISNYESGYSRYGLPDYIAAFSSGWLDIDYHIPKYNLARFHNQFRPSGMLVLHGQNLSAGEQKQLTQEVRHYYQGEGTAGKLLVMAASDPALSPKFVPFNDDPDGAFEMLQEQANANIILAHQWHPSLMVQQPGKLSNSSDIMAAYETVMNTTVADIRESTLGPIRRILTDVIGLNVSGIDILNTEPISLRGSIDPAAVLTTAEQRSLLGLKPNS